MKHLACFVDTDEQFIQWLIYFVCIDETVFILKITEVICLCSSNPTGTSKEMRLIEKKNRSFDVLV